MNIQIQMGGTDCGLFALANATPLHHGIDTTSCVFNQEKMREHSCIPSETGEWRFSTPAERQAIPQPVNHFLDVAGYIRHETFIL